MKRAYKIIPFLLVFLSLLPTLSPAVQYRVIRIVDGDTIIVNYQKSSAFFGSTPQSQSTRTKSKTSPWERRPRITPKKDSKGNTLTLNFRGLLEDAMGVCLLMSLLMESIST
jgi:hypothetical protein